MQNIVVNHGHNDSASTVLNNNIFHWMYAKGIKTGKCFSRLLNHM